MQHDGCSQSMSNAAAEAEASVQAIQQLWRTALEEQYAAQADVAYAGDFPDSFDLAPDFLNELIAVGSPRSNDSSLLQRTQTWSSLTHPAQQHSQTPGDDGQQRYPGLWTSLPTAPTEAGPSIINQASLQASHPSSIPPSVLVHTPPLGQQRIPPRTTASSKAPGCMSCTADMAAPHWPPSTSASSFALPALTAYNDVSRSPSAAAAGCSAASAGHPDPPRPRRVTRYQLHRLSCPDLALPRPWPSTRLSCSDSEVQELAGPLPANREQARGS
ncbi:hypothetical protein V8C86DRAFT_2633936 [Haematococcus lacustris]